MQQLGHRLGTRPIVPGVSRGPGKPGFSRGFARAGLCGAAVTAGLGLLLDAGWALLPTLLGYGLLLIAVRQNLLATYPHRRFGACNTVTLWRAAMVLPLVAALLAGQTAGQGVAAVAAASLLMDGLDGWLARRTGLVSDFGARFDMEVDAALGLVLSLHALAGTSLGPEVLLLGLPRYALLLAALVWPWLRAPLPPSLRRKAICVIQLSVLILLQFPALSIPVAEALVGIAVVLLLASFARDMRLLWTRRA